MDPFQRLPVEIIKSIVHHIPDFVGVESLLLVSARVKAVFQYDPCAVDLDDLLASTYLLAMPDVPSTFRHVALIHRQSVSASSDDGDIESASENSPMGSATLLHMIHTAAQIQRQACACLLTMRRKFCTSVETHLATSIVNEDFAGPFSFIEECRAYWALWHLRHYSDLHKLARERINSPDNTKIIQKLKTYASWNGPTALHYRAEEIWAIAATLSDLGLYASQQKEPSQDRLSRPPRVPLPLFTSFQFPPQAENHPVWCPPPVPEHTTVNEAWDRIVRHPEDSSRGTLFYHQLLSILQVYGLASPAIQDMPPFRRLGVFIWDCWRLYSAGLKFITENIPAPNGGVVQAMHIDQKRVYEMQANWLALRG
ncbi:hypothetical protein BO94DRAFT_536359 [Aspergillus sclerotioniger CBS 115572]|uniref:Uncharacterized protein n=1 Tax=Aspergillus sclerotioniger CBS 115572 TaxID=1450535 RepID=A0A317WCL5_9EURO|nr:hypothetical protein BO94DRAFT_536359 [Aspergillus sclerotioniger CBS 115572]PWY83665.1 hypothetical protein BO94DRAFT_536359 [Aspergillus sclerotioniger CBS 115572]